MRYYRLTKGKVDIGQILPENLINKTVTSDGAFYKSLYYYPQEALDYFNENGRIKGYKGKAYSDYLVFDIDSEDLEGSRSEVIKLIDYLQPRGLYTEMASVISYSGSKGYHLRIKVSTPLEPFQLKKLCTYLAKEAEVKIDPVIYNTTRPFRMVNTKHEKSGLYKVDLPETDVRNYTDLEIREFAKTPQPEFEVSESIDDKLIDKLLEAVNADSVPTKPRIRRPKRPLSDIQKYPCYTRIRMGDIPSGESNTALLRLAQFYKDSGFSRDETHRELAEVSENRLKLHPNTNVIDDSKIVYEILSSIYDGDGYTYGLSDEYLASICTGSCKLHDRNKLKPVPLVFGKVREIPLRTEGFGAKIQFGKPKEPEMSSEDKLKKFGFETFKETSKQFSVFAKEVHARAVETGIPELDQYIKIIPNGLTLINARPSVGKCLGPEVKVMKYNGDIVRADEVKKGDLLMGPDSKPRTVLELGKGREEMFRISPVKGESWTCNKSHILSLRCNSNISKKYKKGEIYNLSVEEYLNSPERVRHHLKLWRTSVDFKAQPVPFDPYLVGIWLAEGSVNHSVLHTGDDEVIKEVVNITNKTENMEAKLSPKIKGCTKVRINSKTHKNPFLDYIRTSCYVNGQKRIPKEYLINNREIRLRLLAGLLDGDGYSHNNTYEITSKYSELAKDIAFLSQTLGFLYTNREKKVKLKGWDEPRTYQRMFISGNTEDIPMVVTRKKSGVRGSKKNHLNIGFKIESIGEGDYYGVELDGDHLYLLSDTTVTHNTSIVLNMLKNTSSKGLKTIFYCADMEKDEFMAKVKSSLLCISPDDVYHLYENPDMQDLVQEAEQQVEQMLSNVLPCYDTNITVDKIEQHLKHFKEQGELPSAIFIDYIQKMEGCHEYGKGVDTLLGLKTLIAKYKVPIIALSQIPRMGGTEETPVLTSGAAKGGSIYEETASIVMNMWRPMKFAPDSAWDNVIVVKVAKNRMGETPPEIVLHFNGRVSEIRGMTEEEYEAYEIRKAEYEEMKKQQKKGAFR
jgi:replicative DNA helicase